MRQVTLANIRAHRARLVSVSIAVILAVAFMAATLLLASSSKATLRESMGAEVAKADVVVQGHDADYQNHMQITSETVAQIDGLPGVVLAEGTASLGVMIHADDRDQPYAQLTAIMEPELEPSTLHEGRLPETSTEVVIDEASLGLLNVQLGDEIGVSLTMMSADGETVDAPRQMTIVGINETSKSPFASGFVNVLATEEVIAELYAELEAFERAHEGSDSSATPEQASGIGGLIYSQVLVKLEPGMSTGDFREHISELSFEGVVPLVQTPDDIVDEQVQQFTNDTDMLLAVLLAFVGIALFVAGLVISNTFSVLVAQRARELALLRCVGASTTQVRRSVLTEAFVMGLIASVLGVGLAFGLLSGLIWFAGATGIAGGVGVFAAGWEAIVLPIVTGLIVTLIAAHGPAREATRVAPLEALRSRSAEVLPQKAGRTRLIVGLTVLALGAAVIAVALMFEEPVISLAVALLGSMITAVGVLMLAVFVIPTLTYRLGRLIFPRGVTGKLAALNTVRNPKRTAATAGALLVGVTLVATVYTGAEVAKSTLSHELAASFPIDMAVIVDDTDIESAELLAQITSQEGVEQAVSARSAYVSTSEDSMISEIWGIDPHDFSAVTRDGDAVLRPGEILLGSPISGESITVTGEAGSLTLTGEQEGAPRYTAFVTPADFEQIAGPHGGESHSSWVALVKLGDGLGTTEILELRDELTELIPYSYIIGEGIERAMFDQIIQMLLLIVTGLLAVAVVIAVIGIGNTLSLSVIERTRENALLRALGLTRRQLRAMLAAEALLTAFTSALIGVALGVGYGFIGATSIMSAFGSVSYDVPWGALSVILGAALVAGLIASVMPARRALKLSPVVGLSTV